VDHFTADLHLGHTNILKYTNRVDMMTDEDRRTREKLLADDPLDVRGSLKKWKPSAASITLMDNTLIARINESVAPDDVLWILGDFACGKGREPSKLAAYRAGIRCRDTRIIWGNHDHRERSRPHFTHAYEAVMLYVRDGEPTRTEDELWANAEGRGLKSDRSWLETTQRVFLSHYAHVVWHHSHRGVFHLYGHSHGNLEPWRENHMPNALSLDVGVDCWQGRPASMPQIAAVLKAKSKARPPHAVDHHKGDTD
jgi:calcineurin-like phosphoesterase family protein